MQYKKELLIAAGFAGGAAVYGSVNRLVYPIIKKKAEEYGKLTGDYYDELIKKGMDPDAAIAETYKKYPHPLWKKLGYRRMEALALLGVSAALTLTKSAKIDNFAKGMMLFSAAKIIYPNPIKKATVEDYTGRL